MSELSDWFGRIGIGRWTNREEWQRAVEGLAVRWLKRTPKIKCATENVMAWQKAGLVLGVGNIAPFVKQSLSEDLETLPTERMNPEFCLLAYALKLKPKNVENFIVRNGEGTFPYRVEIPNIRFVDTIGMVVPYLHWTGRDDCAIRQIEEYDTAMFHGIYPAHAYDIKKQLPMGVFDWGRGCGWYILALVESRNLEGVNVRIVRLAEALYSLQREDGGFGSFLFVDGARMDSSCTALIGRLMLRSYELTGELHYLLSARQCERALMCATRRDGSVDYCQGDTHGIGNYSQVFSLMPFVQGMSLLLSKELDKYETITR